MKRPFSQRIFPVVMSVVALLHARCTFPNPSESGTTPTLSLLGQWRLDSGNITLYHANGQFLHRVQGDEREGPPGFVTIGPEQWRYNDGRSRARYTYIRRGDTLVVQRLTDSALVRAGHAQWKDLGNPIGPPDTSIIAILTAHSWLRLDSTQDSDGSLIRVSRNYYSR